MLGCNPSDSSHSGLCMCCKPSGYVTWPSCVRCISKAPSAAAYLCCSAWERDCARHWCSNTSLHVATPSDVVSLAAQTLSGLA